MSAKKIADELSTIAQELKTAKVDSYDTFESHICDFLLAVADAAGLSAEIDDPEAFSALWEVDIYDPHEPAYGGGTVNGWIQFQPSQRGLALRVGVSSYTGNAKGPKPGTLVDIPAQIVGGATAQKLGRHIAKELRGKFYTPQPDTPSLPDRPAY